MTPEFPRIHPSRQELIERLLPLIVPAADTSTLLVTHRIDLINEDDAR